jgi:hypothetical protein
MPRSKSNKPSIVHPTAASTVVTKKATKRTLAVPIAVLPLGTHVPGVTIPAAPTGDPAVTTPVTPPLSATSMPIPTPSGTTPAATSSTVAPATTSVVSKAVDDPPTVQAPPVPEGFVPPPNLLGYRAFAPRQLELMSLPGIITDLGNFTDYTSVIGVSAPPAATVQSKISTGLSWRKAHVLSEAWAAYVRSENAMAWKEATTLLDEIKPFFAYALAKNANLATAYPSLAAYFASTKAATAKATATREKNAKGKAATAVANATAAAVAAATATAVAATKAEVAAVVPAGKGVTVTV